MPDPAPRPSSGGSLRRARVFLEPHRHRGLAVAGLSALLAAAGALQPLVLKYVFDGLAGGAGMRPVLVGVWLLALLALVRESLAAASNWLVWRVRLSVHQDLLEATLGKLHTLPVEFHRREGVGGLLTRLDRSITGFLQAVQEIGAGLVPAVVYLVLAGGIMLALDWRLSLVVLLFTPLPPLVGMWAAPEQVRREGDLLERWVSLYSRFNEVLTGVTTVRSFAMEEREKQRFLSGVKAANRVVRRGVARDSGVGAARSLIGGLAQAAAIGVGGWLVLRGEATVGTVVAFMGYVGGLFGPVEGVTRGYQTLRRAAVSADQIFHILDAPDALGDPPDPVSLDDLAGRVDFEDVHFSYGDGTPILNGVTLHVEPGETVAVVGPSGSGKSTLMALLQRLYDPERGTVRVDGIDVRRIRAADLRRRMGVVLQDALLFQDSVRDNIAYGRPGASLEEIEEAARVAHADGFIRRLPDGYDTLVGERGNRLSAGERQRIAMARALLKDPRILILDEPTSALDVESEALVQEALERLMEGRTALVIAHRLSTVVRADRIVVIRGGRVVEQGAHHELVERDGYYAAMVRQQVEGLLPREALNQA